ncbi:MAG: chromate transporter [Verrucomicrobiota bacterium]|nr:chromate transporter [Verrucomicrobiota bacterium]
MDSKLKEPANYTRWQLVAYALKLGTWGFGGPVALVGYMHRDLVEKRRWISEGDYKEGLAFAQLAPGPLAAQLAMYLGYVHYRVLGATLVGIGFVLPSFFMVVALGWAYVRYGGLAWMQAVFYGVGACVIGIIANSAVKLTRKTVGSDRLLWAIFAVVAATTIVTESEKILLILIAGVVVWFVKAPPKFTGKIRSVAWPLAVATGGVSAAGVSSSLWTILLYFSKAGAFVFGSGLAIVPFLYGGVVKQYHWLDEHQFVDAVAVAMITPGPVVITVGFIGYIVAGLGGATMAAIGTFLPCYLCTVILAPYFKKHGKRPAIYAFVTGVTAAAVGAIAGSVVVLARRSVIDIPTAIIAAMTLFLCWKIKEIPEPVIVLAAALCGLAMRLWLHRSF